MGIPFLTTERLLLELESTEAELARIDAMPEEDRAQVSPVWLARLRATPVPSAWTHGISLLERTTGAVIGVCGFKGPPDGDGVVEIAYGLEAAHRGRGYAREAARALTEYALATSGVQRIRAHTLRDNTPSARVLEACGFTYIGEVIDPEDGLVSRWELRGR
jgi:ribosomal-protein-alanine N-acetyltransferase